MSLAPKPYERWITAPLAALSVSVLLVCAAPTSSAEAQACCAGTGSGEVGLVGPCHDGGLTTILGYQRALGSYDADGDFHRNTGASVDDLTLTVAGGMRFVDRRIFVGAVVPMRLQHRRFGEHRSARVGLGDLGVSARAMVVQGSMRGITRGRPDTWVPAVDLVSSLQAPTGRAPERSTDAIGADVMGMGAWTLGLGARVTSFLTLRHSLSVFVGWRHAFARDVGTSDRRQRFALGELVDVRLTWAFIPNLFYSGGAFVAFTHTGKASQDGVELPRSAAHRTAVGAFFTRYLRFPHLELSLLVSIDTLFPHASANTPQVGPSVMIAMSRWFHRAWSGD